MSITTQAEYDTLKGLITVNDANFWTVGAKDGQDVWSWDDGASTFDADLAAYFSDTLDKSDDALSSGSCKAVQKDTNDNVFIWNADCDAAEGYAACKKSYFLEFEILVEEPCETTKATYTTVPPATDEILAPVHL
jgi:hypothetical protein